MKHARRAASAETKPRKRATPKKPRSASALLFKLEIRVAVEEAEAVGAALVEEGGGGAVHEELPHEARVACFGEDRGKLDGLAREMRRRLALSGVRATVLVGKAPRSFSGWQTDWMQGLEAVRISPTLVLVPTTASAPDDTSGTVVRLEPAMAFGFGEHATTRMVAAEVEARCRAGARRVLDFGAGTGVLAIVAVVSGAASAVGLDSDKGSVLAAQRNAALNGVSGKCRFSTARLARLRATFELVVANVDVATLGRLAEELAARVAPGGTLLVTGFLAEDARALSRRYRALGFAASRPREESGWALLSLRRK